MENNIRPTAIKSHNPQGPKGLLGNEAAGVKGPKMNTESLEALRQLAKLANELAK